MQDFNIAAVNGELRADSRLFAPRLDIRHRQIIDNIRKYQGHFLELGHLPFETEVGFREQGGGKAQEYALLNEDQAYFLLTLSRNSDAVVACKLALVKAFRDARASLAGRDLARIEGKRVRAAEADAIKLLVEYATDAGSSNATKYYLSITRMTYDLLGLEAGTRDQMDDRQLKSLAMAETMVDIAIRDGMKAGMPYKAIYQMAKLRVSSMVPALSMR